ncbi:MAG: lactate racemase domain-containing protein [Methanofastidiosum sp.]|jgi:nickel-dependent lactate racemase|nr:lactate racemase domain-containing protein [Methanofastidiosum sp.]
MKLDISYKKDTISIEMPDKNLLGIVEPKEVKGSAKENALKKAIENPTSHVPLNDFLKKHKSIIFLINDGQRPTPTKKILDTIYPVMKSYMNKIEFMIATGSHRGPTEEEFNNIFGPYFPEFKNKITVHDSRKDELLQHIGKTDRGTELYINKKVLENEAIVTIGSSEPHYFAGYTGTRKSFLPGVSSIKTITANHKHALSPNSKTLSLKGNPVHDDMEDVVKKIMKINPNVFAINVVADGEGNIFDAQAGDII